jgi:hypothetical protein
MANRRENESHPRSWRGQGWVESLEGLFAGNPPRSHA